MHTRVRLVVLGGVAVVAASCSPSAAIIGRIIDARGAPQADVSVFAISARRPVAEARSNAEGRFTLEGGGGVDAVFGLASSRGDLGVWRADLEAEEGLVDVGDLELHAVSSHESVRWLREVGFDEQLTHGDAALTWVSGGTGGEPLVAMRQGTRTLEVFRVDDDGTTVKLLEIEGVHMNFVRTVVDAEGARLEPRGLSPVFLFTERLADGRWVVVAQRGGLSRVSAAGATTTPVESIEWVDVMTGARLLQVPVPAGVFPTVVPARGVFLEEAGQPLWFEVGADGPRMVSLEGPGPLLADAQGVFRLVSSAGHVRLDRLEGATFRRGSDVAVEGPFEVLNSFFEGATVGVLGRVGNESLVLLRFDRSSLAARVDEFTQQRASLGAVRTRSWTGRLCDGAPGADFVVAQEGGIRVFRATSGGLSIDEAATPLRSGVLIQAVCVTNDGWWLAVRDAGVTRLLRRSLDGVEAMTLDGSTGIHGVGRFAVHSSWKDNARAVDLIDAVSSLEPRAMPFRVPAVRPIGVRNGWMLGLAPTSSGQVLVRTRVTP